MGGLTLFFHLLEVLSKGEYRVLSSRDFAAEAAQTAIQTAWTYADRGKMVLQTADGGC